MPLSIRISQVCLVYHLRRAARIASRALDLAIADSGLNASQFTVLVALRAAELGSEQAVTLGALARRLAMDRSTLQRNLSPLKTAGLINVDQRRGRRGSTVVATDRARDLLAAAMPQWQASQETLVGRLGESEAGRVLAALGRLEP
jgi:DNA-binding MarR family transcriptional regulator